MFDPTGVRAHDLHTRDEPANHYTVDVVRGIIPVLYLTRLIYVNLENSFMKICFVHKKKGFPYFLSDRGNQTKSKN